MTVVNGMRLLGDVMKIELIQGDCLSEMQKKDNESVDFVFYDPPYNIKKKYDGYNDNLPMEDYIEWMSSVFTQAKRISKHGVGIYTASKLTKLFWDIIGEAHLIPVHKRAAGVFSGNYMLQYHSLLVTRKPVIKCKDLWNDVRLPGEGYFFREPRYDHPGLTGLEMTKKVLQYFTIEGETVFDPFAGVGTTAVACKLMNRNFIGTEQSAKYISIAQQRLDLV